MSKTNKLTIRTETQEIWNISRRMKREIVGGNPLARDVSVESEIEIVKEMKPDHDRNNQIDINNGNS